VNADPYNLDQTELAQAMRVIRSNPVADDLPDEPEHPLCNSAAIAAIYDHVQQMKNQLWKTRYPDGSMVEDAYFMFDEGLLLRPEIVAQMTLDYLREHPELLAQ